MSEKDPKKENTNHSDRISVSIPLLMVNSLKREFSLADADVESFVISVIEKAIMEHASTVNSAIFSEAETKEIEDDLRGLGYI